MPWTKQINVTATARVENSDLQIRFFFGDAQATPPNALRAELSLVADRSDGKVELEPVDAVLANIPQFDVPLVGATGRAQLINALTILRDAGLAVRGFTLT